MKLPKLGIGFWSILAVIVLFAAYAGLLEYSRPHVSGDSLRYSDFVEKAERDQILSAEILDSDGFVIGSYRRPNGSVADYNTPYFKATTLRAELLGLLIPNGVRTTVDQQVAKSFIGPATVLLPALILVVVLVYLIMSYRRGSGLFGLRSGARKLEAEESQVTFADVAAQDRAVTELRELSQFLSDPDRYAALGAKIPKGVLLYGPPGCGKTLMARALAGEVGASFFSISGSDFVELYVGVGASRVRDLFKEARENAPSIVFIDEIDSIGRRRGGAATMGTGAREEQEQALNQVLSELDGFSVTEGVIVIGATNRADVLDPALLRPGRFDRTVGLERPDEAGRAAILAVHARGKPLATDIDLDGVAHRAVGMTGADLANVVNEAGLLAARNNRQAIAQADFAEATKRILEAPERQRRLSMTDRDLGRGSLAEERVTFADVAGVDEALEELNEVKEFLDFPERFVEMGARFPRGFLLVGPPGVGKTLLARAVATEANAAFISMAGTEFTELFVGEGAGRVRDLFAQARAVQPTILFIDELDAMGSARGGGSEREREQTLNQILIELDGFRPRDGVIVMAASNRPEILDPALVRAGRFDRTVSLGLPDREGRRAILAVHAAGKRLGPDVDLDTVASLTRGMSGADLANVMNESALLAARRRTSTVSGAFVDEAIERVGMGISRSHRLSEADRRRIAYHEAGHALVATALPGGLLPHRLTILPRGHALGAVWHTEADNSVVQSRPGLIDHMAVLLSGRVAEQTVLGDAGSGAADDLSRVTQVARQMVCDLGMSDALGALSYGNGAAGNGYSDETARLIDTETRKLVTEAEERSREVLAGMRAALDRVAEGLIEHETLSADAFRALLDQGSGERPGPGEAPVG